MNKETEAITKQLLKKSKAVVIEDRDMMKTCKSLEVK